MMNALPSLRPLRRFLPRSAIIVGCAALAACAGLPPSDQIAVSRSAVNNAVSAGGTEFAPVEMKSAQDNLSQADAAVFAKDFDKARMLAQKSELDARVAERTALAGKAKRAVADARESTKELREESLRITQ